MGKNFFIDLTRCTACRGCQVACKQWKKLPASETKNWGSHQNPVDFEFTTYKLVRFTETMDKGELKWLFMPDQCRHCVEPPCKMMGDAFDERAVIMDEATGAVVFTQFTSAIDGMSSEELCPYNVPRMDEASGVWGKCDMCYDRVHNGLLPACVQSCPTGAMRFGEREEMLALANSRLVEAKKRFPGAVLGNADRVRVIFLFESAGSLYHKWAVAESRVPSGPMTRRSLLAGLGGALDRA